MTEAEQLRAQLDRIEAKLDRLGKLEERQNHQSRQLDKHETQIDDHDRRLYALERTVALRTNQTEGRWSAFFRVLGVVTTVGSSLATAFLVYLLGIR
ncbi:MAG: hypothetical protein VX796_09295 [Pseudomonadota bacterium]|nr:hypothetical protein [Pseudomonadota bacterium]